MGLGVCVPHFVQFFVLVISFIIHSQSEFDGSVPSQWGYALASASNQIA